MDGLGVPRGRPLIVSFIKPVGGGVVPAFVWPFTPWGSRGLGGSGSLSVPQAVRTRSWVWGSAPQGGLGQPAGVAVIVRPSQRGRIRTSKVMSAGGLGVRGREGGSGVEGKSGGVA